MPSDIPQRELLELVIYAEEVPAVAERLKQFLNIGAAIMICDADEIATAAAGKTIFSYHIEDTMKRLLLACRAGNFIDGDLQNVDRHSDSLGMANAKVRGAPRTDAQRSRRTRSKNKLSKPPTGGASL
jgi:hypothetical protein